MITTRGRVMRLRHLHARQRVLPTTTFTKNNFFSQPLFQQQQRPPSQPPSINNNNNTNNNSNNSLMNNSNNKNENGQKPPSLLDQYNILEYDPGRISITGYTDRSFDIGAVRIFGSLIATERDFFCWNVQSMDQITIESLQLFEFLNPTPQILLIGTGKTYQRVDRETRDYFRSVGIVIEEMTTKNALSTFNVLNQENRHVACALLSLSPVDVTQITPENHPALFLEIEELSKSDPQYIKQERSRQGSFT